MKNPYLSLLLISFFVCANLLLTGCNNDDEDENSIILAETSLSAYLNIRYTIEIMGGSGNYSATIEAKDIASVSINTEEEGYFLWIYPHKLGEALITVTDDESGRYATCELTVESASLMVSVRYGVDAQEPDLIAAHLLETNPLPEGTQISFPSSTLETSSCLFTFPGKTEPVSVPVYMESMPREDIPDIYSQMNLIKNFVGTCMKWTLLLDGQEIHYDCLLVVGESTGIGVLVYDLCLYQDLTDYYQTLFPDLDVKGVVRVLDLHL